MLKAISICLLACCCSCTVYSVEVDKWEYIRLCDMYTFDMMQQIYYDDCDSDYESYIYGNVIGILEARRIFEKCEKKQPKD